MLLPSAKQLLALHEDFRAEEDRLATGRLTSRDGTWRRSVKVPREEFDAWFGEVRAMRPEHHRAGAAGAARRRARRHRLPHVPAPRGARRDHHAWRNGQLVFALCDRCSASHDVVFSPTEAGVEVRARRRTPLVVGGGP